MESLGVPLGPYRATKLEYLSGRKHRQRLKKYGNCFTAGEASQSYKVTRQQTIQLLRIFLKNHVIEDIKGRWGSENVDDNNQLFRFPAISPLKTLPRRTPKKHGIHLSQENAKKIKHEIINEDQENAVGNRELSQEDVEEISRYVVLIYLQTILGVPSLEEVINPKQVIPQYIMYNMANTSKHDWPRTDDMNNSTYVGFKQVVFRTITDYFLDLPEPLLTFEYYKLSVNILSFLQPQLERVAIDAVQLCCLLLPPPNCRKLQLLMHMISQMSQNVDMRKLHDALGTISLRIHTFSWCVLCCAEEVDLDELLAGRLVSFLTGHHQEILQTAAEKHLDYLRKGHIESPGDGLFVSLPTYSYYKQISARDFDEQKVSTSQAAIAELLGNIIKNKSLPLEEKRKKLKQFQNEYPLIYQERFPTTESETALFGDEPTIKQPMLILRKPKFHSLRY
uniref:DEP domain-containing protein n=1 Tax=Colobus angolensis palliatus TaxID=336983 RepID=A0A2K5J8L8_COLAP